ncbi:MAG: type IV pilus secretin PilQ [Anaeromyxobacter sp.]
MTSRFMPLVGLLLWGALSGPARAGDANQIRAIDVAERDGAVELTIQGSRPPSYSVFKLQDPQRLVVDLAGADVAGVASPAQVGKAGVVSVSTAQYQDERSAVGRVIVTLDGPRRYEVEPRGDAVVVRVLSGDAPAPAAAAVTASAAQAPVRPERSEPAGLAESKGEAADPHLVSQRVDDATPSGRPARAVTAIRPSAGRVVVATDGEVGRMEIIELADPPRLAIDLAGVSKAPRGTVKLDGPFAQARFGRDQGKVRVVLDAQGAMPAYEVQRVKGGVAVVLAAAAKAAPAAAPVAAVAAAVAPQTEAVRPERSEPAGLAESKGAPKLASISAVRFTGDASSSRIEISGKASFAVSRPDARTMVLTLEAAALPRKLERSLDTAAFKGPVQMVSSFNQPTTGQVRIVATLRGPATDQLVETPAGLAWTLSDASAAPAVAAAATVRAAAPAAAPAQAEAAVNRAAGFSAEAPAYAVSGAPQARGYTGRRITLDFHDIEIRNLLRLIADVSKKNIVVADDVEGKVTVSLRNIPWDEALELVLRSKGLDQERLGGGDVIRVAKAEVIAKEAQARAQAQKDLLPLVPLKVRMFPVNFARAADLQGRVKDMLTERGSVSVDERTNTLIVKDVAEALVRAEGLVRNLDTEIPQVLIESRIVEASSNFNRALGVQWGGNAAFTQATGNPTGLAFPYNAGAAGGAGGGPTTGTSGSPNYAVNLPAAIGQGSGGGIGFSFGSLGGAFNLNLRLSALENSGQIKTISAPKISTIDNREATIGQGISIPFSQTSASGVNTTFIEAKLELKVTPHVSPDGSILLKIKATNNAPNPQLTGANGQPSITKREAETEVLVRDGETTVIGGIYTRSMSDRKSSVPWLGDIPILGFFFRTTTTQDDHTELLIFITPRILNRSAATPAAGQ